MVCDAVIDPEGRTEAYQFYPAVIHSHARLTYTQVWGALQGEEGGLAAVGDRLDDIRALYDLFKTLRKARDARHTLDLETKETMAVFDDKGVISDSRCANTMTRTVSSRSACSSRTSAPQTS